MNRYEARRAPGHAEGWDVVDTANPCRGLIAEMVEDAEASIIAWALNAVADGGRLEAIIPTQNVQQIGGKSARQFELRTYTGPTDGVAP